MTLLTHEEEKSVQKEYHRILKLIAGSKIMGIPLDLNDERLVVIAAYHGGMLQAHADAILLRI